MEDYILLCSGFPVATVEALRREWTIVDVPLQQDAMALLESGRPLPLAAVIGCVHPAWPDAPDTVFDQPAAHLLLEKIRELDTELPVIVSTAVSSPRAIVDLVKRGAFDYIHEFKRESLPPSAQALEVFDQQLEAALRRAVLWRKTILENRRYRRDLFEDDLPVPICARSPAMVNVIRTARKVAPTSATVLITGESGTGKEIIARTIHGLSPRAAEPFVAVNCGAVSDELLFSELFGHKKGAFTGAAADRQGLLREAGRGTLFLDEIGEVSPAFQVALLRVLENRTARALGAKNEYEIHARFLAASNIDLEKQVRAGRFREDLFYRLNVLNLHLLPLRERREDIPLLVNFFLQQITHSYSMRIEGITPRAMQVLERHDWPGNVRQLRNMIERAVILCESDRLDIQDFTGGLSTAKIGLPLASGTALADELRRLEAGYIRQALSLTGDNITRAAMMLGMKRTTLGRRIRELKLLNGDHTPAE